MRQSLSRFRIEFALATHNYGMVAAAAAARLVLKQAYAGGRDGPAEAHWLGA